MRENIQKLKRPKFSKGIFPKLAIFICILTPKQVTFSIHQDAFICSAPLETRAIFRHLSMRTGWPLRHLSLRSDSPVTPRPSPRLVMPVVRHFSLKVLATKMSSRNQTKLKRLSKTIPLQWVLGQSPRQGRGVSCVRIHGAWGEVSFF